VVRSPRLLSTMAGMSFRTDRVVLSGSFKKDIAGLRLAYNELVTNNCQVLSPHRLEFDDSEFARDRAEADMTIREIEDHHLLALKQADFLWLHIPDGYFGLSASFEVGYARACGVPVFANQPPTDAMLGEYVQRVPSVFAAKTLLAVGRE